MLEELLQKESDHVKTFGIAGIVSLAIFYFLIYPLYLNPLCKVPGPKICALSKFWILYKSWSEQRNHYVDELHKEYGPIVRIGPNEVDISDSDYLNEVFIRDMEKSKFYSQFVNYNSHNTFSTIDKVGHRQSRKVTTRFYSKTHVCTDEVQDYIRGIMSKLLKIMDEYKTKPINAFILWSDMAMDAITIFSFGTKYYQSVLDDPFGLGKEIVMEFFTQSSSWFWDTQLPSLRKLAVPKSVDIAAKKCYDWIEAQFNKSLGGIGDSQQTLVNTVLGEKAQSSPKPVFDKGRAKSECFDHIAAGHNTTATTLSYVYFSLARNPEVQKKLIEELKQFNGGKYLAADDYNSQIYAQIENLPYLNAVVDETLRVYSAIPGQEPRVAPNGGMIWRGSKETPKCIIPQGTVITIQPWSIHRNKDVFTDPNHWNPDRWMIDNEEKLKVMHKNLIPFSAGARMCIGKNLALCEIKMNISNMMSRYRVKLQDNFDYDKYSYFADMYTSVPAYGQMPLIYEPLLDPIESKE